MTGPTHLSSHLNLTFYLILSIYIWINFAANLHLLPSVSVFLMCSLFSQTVQSLSFPYHAALLRRLINHSGSLSVTPSQHTAVVSVAHIFIHTIVLVSQGGVSPITMSVYKFLRVKNEAALQVTKDCFPSRRILPRF